MKINKYILTEAIKVFGYDNQKLKAIEELNELSTELVRYFIKKEDNIDKIIDEMADVIIMIEQLKIIFDAFEVKLDNRIFQKMNRLENRLKEKNNESL